GLSRRSLRAHGVARRPDLPLAASVASRLRRPPATPDRAGADRPTDPGARRGRGALRAAPRGAALSALPASTRGHPAVPGQVSAHELPARPRAPGAADL